MVRRSVPSTILLATLLSARLSLAGSEEDPRAVQARQACLTGQVERGIRLLADYLASTDDATAIYNMGRCYQQNGLPDKALLQFREYLRKAKDLPADEKKQVDDYIRELEAQQQAPSSRTLPPPLTLESRAAPPASGRPALRTTGYVLGGLGVVALGVAVVEGINVQSANSDIRRQNMMKPYGDALTVKKRQQDGDRAQTIQWVSLGIGAAALAAGTVCYVLGMPPRESSTALVPWVAPGGTAVGLSVGGAY
jgi:hypothetical protein